jgi:hypothetical protein
MKTIIIFISYYRVLALGIEARRAETLVYMARFTKARLNALRITR